MNPTYFVFLVIILVFVLLLIFGVYYPDRKKPVGQTIGNSNPSDEYQATEGAYVYHVEKPAIDLTVKK